MWNVFTSRNGSTKRTKIESHPHKSKHCGGALQWTVSPIASGRFIRLKFPRCNLSVCNSNLGAPTSCTCLAPSPSNSGNVPMLEAMSKDIQKTWNIHGMEDGTYMELWTWVCFSPWPSLKNNLLPLTNVDKNDDQCTEFYGFFFPKKKKTKNSTTITTTPSISPNFSPFFSLKIVANRGAWMKLRLCASSLVNSNKINAWRPRERRDGGQDTLVPSIGGFFRWRIWGGFFFSKLLGFWLLVGLVGFFVGNYRDYSDFRRLWKCPGSHHTQTRWLCCTHPASNTRNHRGL